MAGDTTAHVREGLSFAADDPHKLIVDCRSCGEVARIPAGELEYERAEQVFAEHVRGVSAGVAEGGEGEHA